MRNVYILMILVCAILAGSSSWMVGEPEGQLPITFDKMLRIKGPPGEVLYVVEGKDHGLESLSTVITVTQPGSGAPPHKHKCEEVHILTKGKVQYTVGEESFTAEGPFVLRIPAGTIHSVTNIGSEPINIIGVAAVKSQVECEAE